MADKKLRNRLTKRPPDENPSEGESHKRLRQFGERIIRRGIDLVRPDRRNVVEGTNIANQCPSTSDDRPRDLSNVEADCEPSLDASAALDTSTAPATVNIAKKIPRYRSLLSQDNDENLELLGVSTADPLVVPATVKVAKKTPRYRSLLSQDNDEDLELLGAPAPDPSRAAEQREPQGLRVPQAWDAASCKSSTYSVNLLGADDQRTPLPHDCPDLRSVSIAPGSDAIREAQSAVVEQPYGHVLLAMASGGTQSAGHDQRVPETSEMHVSHDSFLQSSYQSSYSLHNPPMNGPSAQFGLASIPRSQPPPPTPYVGTSAGMQTLQPQQMHPGAEGYDPSPATTQPWTQVSERPDPGHIPGEQSDGKASYQPTIWGPRRHHGSTSASGSAATVVSTPPVETPTPISEPQRQSVREMISRMEAAAAPPEQPPEDAEGEDASE